MYTSNLEQYEIYVGMKELIDISDDTLSIVLGDSIAEKDKDAILKILFIGLSFGDDIVTSFENRIAYYTNLVEQVGNLLGVSYTDEEKLIYALYVSPRVIINDLDNLDYYRNILGIYESTIKIETSYDSIWYARENVKYKLLDLYAWWPNQEHYEEMKKLLEDLKSTKTEFEEMKEKLMKYVVRN